MDKRGGSIKIFRQNFSVSQCRKIPQGNPLLLHQFRVSKKFGKEEGGVSRYSVENFLSHSAENFRRRILFCCIIFGYRKSLDKRGEGRIKIFQRNFFVSVPKISVGKSFSDSLISGTEKVWRRGGGGGGIKISRQSFFCLTVPKISVRKSFTVALISGTEKVWIRGEGGGSMKMFRRNFCLTVPKKFVGESFSNSINSGIEKC